MEDLIRPHPAILESQLLCDTNREWELHKNASLKHQTRLVTTASNCEQAGIDCASVATEKVFKIISQSWIPKGWGRVTAMQVSHE